MSSPRSRVLLCRLGLHHYVDFPDPNPESGGLEKQGYVACTRCPKEKDKRAYLSRSGKWGMPGGRRPTVAGGQPRTSGKRRRNNFVRPRTWLQRCQS